MNKKLTIFVVLPVAIAIIAGIFILILYKIQDYKTENNSSFIYRLEDTTRERVYADSLNDLKNAKQKAVDSLSAKIYEFTTGMLPFAPPNAGFIGMINARMLHPINKESADSIDTSKKYLVLSYLGLNIRDNDSRFAKYIFYTRNDSGYISKLKEVQSSKKDIRLLTYSHFRNVDYLYLPSRINNRGGIAILIKNDFLKSIFRVGTFLIIFLFIYVMFFVVVNSLVILLNISRNHVFNSSNIFRLKWLTIACFFILLLPYLFTLILYLIYFKDFYPEVSFTHSFWDNDYKWCIAGIVYLLLFLAFRKGHKLQQEQDLTI